MSTLLRPLRQRTFVLLWSATLLSNLGFWMLDLTLGWLIAGLTSAPSIVALVPAAGMLPTFLLSLPAGAFGDAVDRRRFLIAVQATFFVLLAIFATLVALDLLSVWLVVGFALLHGSLSAISSPTRQATLPSLVGKESVRGAVMLSAIGYNGSRAVGPLLGGLVLAYFGPVAAIQVYAASCLAVGLVIYSWKYRPEPGAKVRILRQSAEGLSYVWAHPAMRVPLVLTGLYFLTVSPLWAFAPLIAKGYAHGNGKIFGLFMMALGLGAVVGGMSRHITTQASFGAILGLGAALSAGGLAIIGTTQLMSITLIGFFIAGLGWIGVSAGINSHMLLEAEPQFRSRVIAIVLIVFSGGLGLGSLLWGQVAQHIGVAGTCLAGAVLLLVLAGATLRIRGLRS